MNRLSRCVLLTTLWLALPLSAALAADIGPAIRVVRDIAYSAASAEPGQTLDLYLSEQKPRDRRPRPVVLFVHGGAWRKGDKSMVGAKPAAFVGQGYAFASANYRLADTVSPREQAQDVAEAIRWLHEHGGEHGCDPHRIFLMGHSAGAHLVALASTDETLLKACDLDLAAIAGTILLDGAGYDVPRQLQLARLPAMREMYVRVFGADADAQRRASPIEHVGAGKSIPPFLLFHVGMRADSREQAEALATKLRDAGVAAEVVHAADKNHLTLNRELGAAGDEPTNKILAWLREASAAPSPSER
jgi:acetyl esterase/lipase